MRWTAEVWADYDRRRAAGESQAEIALAFGTTEKAVSAAVGNHHRRHGYADGQKAPMKWTAEVCDTLREMWAGGWTPAEIGQRLGVSYNAIVQKAARLGLAARGQVRRKAPPRPSGAGGAAKGARLGGLRKWHTRPPLPAGHPLTWGLIQEGLLNRFSFDPGNGGASAYQPAPAMPPASKNPGFPGASRRAA